MSEYPSRDNLTRAQREVREKAGLLIAKAWKEADAMLADAGIAGDPDLFTHASRWKTGFNADAATTPATMAAPV